MNRYWLLIVILLAAVLGAPDPGTSRAISAAHDFAHAPVFGCIAVLLVMALRQLSLTREWSVGLQYAIAVAGSSAAGLATEILQASVGRDSSWIDLRSDVIGAIAFTALFAAVDRRINRTALRIGSCSLGIALMVVHSWPFAQTSLAYLRRNQAFPVVFEARDDTPDYFAGRLLSRFAYEPLPASYAVYPNEQALHIRFKRGEWLGMYVDEPYPDWRGFSELAIDLTNPSARPLSMAVRIHDRAHDHRFEDRFNKAFELPPQSRTTLLIALTDIERGPLGRTLDLQHVAQLVLFTGTQNEGREVYVSRMWLQ